MDIPPLYERENDTHKGDYGRIFVIAGSEGMVGAACLTAQAAYRAGAGYVCLALPERLARIVPSNPEMECVLTAPVPETEDGAIALVATSQITKESKNYDVVAMGPGLSRNPQTQEMVAHLLPDLNHSLIIDADALNSLARHSEVIPKINREKGLPIFTPHPVEFARLTQAERPLIEPQMREQGCRDYAAENEVVCILKGHKTVVSDGDRVYINNTGNPGMATAGAGDVLTGLLAALRGQGYDSFEAAVLGVYLHGLAGDFAAEELGIWGINARDVLFALPSAFKKHFEDTKN